MRYIQYMFIAVCFFCLCSFSVVQFNSIAAAQQADSTVAPVQLLSIVDDTGTVIELQKPATRIIPLYGAFIDLFEELDAVNLLAGRTAADETTASVAHLPGIGTHMRPNLELIVGLNPDLVLQMAGRQEVQEHVRILRSLGIPVAVFEVDSFPALFSTMQRIGILIGKEAQAQHTVLLLNQRLDTVTERITQQMGTAYEKPCVFFEVRENTLLAAGQSSIVTAIIEQAGAKNCVQAEGRVVRFSEEELLSVNPDFYVYQEGIMNPFPTRPGQRPAQKVLPAVQQGRVLKVEQALFSRPSLKSVDAVEQLAGFILASKFIIKNKQIEK